MKHAKFFQLSFYVPGCTKHRVEAWHPCRAHYFHSKQLWCQTIGLSCGVNLWCNDTVSVQYPALQPRKFNLSLNTPAFSLLSGP